MIMKRISLPTKEQAVAAQRKLNNQQRNTRTSSRPPASPYYNHPASPRSTASSPVHKNAIPRRTHEEHGGRKKQKVANGSPHPMPRTSSDEHRNLLMAIFLSDDPEHIPELLQSSPQNMNIDVVIDDEGNTALHWATALARVTIVKWLVSKGANPACANYAGETPLMRCVTVTNSFDNNTFPTILRALSSSLTAVDHKKQTVLHRASATASIHGRSQAAVYYMHHLLSAISSYPAAVPVLDWQDDRGDTALNIAARLQCSDIAKLLMRAGATKSTKNNAGLSSEDYAESSPNEVQESGTDEQQQQQSQQKQSIEPSERGREIVSTVQKIVDALDEEYGTQLSQRDQELKTIQEELEAATKELESTRKALEAKQTQSQQLVEAQQKIRNLQTALQGEWDGISTVPANNTTAIDEIDEKQDIDELFSVRPENNESLSRTQQLERQITLLESRIAGYTQNDQHLRSELEGLKAQSAEKELQCKRLIAACCNLPIEKIDDLVEPLTLAIESDPPDLDLARVIGFMEKIRRQGAFSEGLPSSSPSSSSPTQSSALAVPTSSIPATTFESETMPSSEGAANESTAHPPNAVTTPVN